MHSDNFGHFLKMVFDSPDLSTLQDFYDESQGWLPTASSAFKGHPSTSPMSPTLGSYGAVGGGAALRLTDRILRGNRSDYNDVRQRPNVPAFDDDDDISVTSESLDLLCAAAASILPGRATESARAVSASEGGLYGKFMAMKPRPPRTSGSSSGVPDREGVVGLRNVGETWALVDEVDAWMGHVRAAQRLHYQQIDGPVGVANAAGRADSLPGNYSTADTSLLFERLSRVSAERASAHQAAVNAVHVSRVNGLVNATEKLVVIQSSCENAGLTTATEDTVTFARVVSERKQRNDEETAVRAEVIATQGAEGLSCTLVGGNQRADVTSLHSVITSIASAPAVGELSRCPLIAVASSQLPKPLEAVQDHSVGGSPVSPADADGASGSSRQSRTIAERLIRGQFMNPFSRSTIAAAESSVDVFDVASSHFRRVTSAMFQGAVTSVIFSPDGRYLITGSADGVVRVWHALATSKQLIPITTFACAPADHAVTSLACLPDSCAMTVMMMASAGPSAKSLASKPLIVAAGSEDGSIHLFDALRAQTVWKEKPMAQSPPVDVTAIFNDSCSLQRAQGKQGTASSLAAFFAQERAGRADHNEEACGQRAAIDGFYSILEAVRRAPEAVRSLSFNADGTLLLVVSVAGAVLLHTSNGETIHRFDPADLGHPVGETGQPRTLSSKNQITIASDSTQPSHLHSTQTDKAGHLASTADDMTCTTSHNAKDVQGASTVAVPSTVMLKGVTGGTDSNGLLSPRNADHDGASPFATGPVIPLLAIPGSSITSSSISKHHPQEGNAAAEKAEVAPIPPFFTQGVLAPQSTLPNHLFLCTSDGRVALFAIYQNTGHPNGTQNPPGPKAAGHRGNGPEHVATVDGYAAVPKPAAWTCEAVWSECLPGGAVTCVPYVGPLTPSKNAYPAINNVGRAMGPAASTSGAVLCDLRGNVTVVSVHSCRGG